MSMLEIAPQAITYVAYCKSVEEMSNKQILKKIWKLLWNKDKKGLDLADSESTHVTTHVPHIILSVQVVSLIYNSLSSEQWYNGPKNKFLIPN